jgi:hypothetical protein
MDDGLWYNNYVSERSSQQMSTTPATILWWRIRPGVYESIDAEFRIERVARDSWTLWGDFYTVQVGYEGETAT